MKSTAVAALAIALQGAVVLAQSPNYGQCGGIGWTGATTCNSGWTCIKSNDYYSQCLPGGSTTTSATTTKPTTTSTGPTTTTTTSGPVPTGNPGTTLQTNYLWIRAVEAPNFHKYLQSYKLYTATDAVLGSYTTAGQFNIVNGQLVQLINTNGTLLYAHVEKRADATVNKLKVSWQTTLDTYGTFAFQGDAVTWTTPGVTRSNTAAWLACTDATEGTVAYINLGAYGYQTPAGCADETIHYYNDKTASS